VSHSTADSTSLRRALPNNRERSPKCGIGIPNVRLVDEISKHRMAKRLCPAELRVGFDDLERRWGGGKQSPIGQPCCSIPDEGLAKLERTDGGEV
jgi:hypothetical protein